MDDRDLHDVGVGVDDDHDVVARTFAVGSPWQRDDGVSTATFSMSIVKSRRCGRSS
jgi:hypothetical protein